jgi:DNA-binding XRE family transcriptional regulator
MIKNKLKEIRMKEYMLNQKEFAEKLEIAQGQYNRYEKELAAPTLEIALRISYKLNKDIRDIFSLVE